MADTEQQLKEQQTRYNFPPQQHEPTETEYSTKWPEPVRSPGNRPPIDPAEFLHAPDSFTEGVPSSSFTDPQTDGGSNTEFNESTDSERLDLDPNRNPGTMAYTKEDIMKFSGVTTLEHLLKSAEDMHIPPKEMEEGMKVEEEHKDTVNDIYEKIKGRKPSLQELDQAFEEIVKDHEKETIDEVGEPVYYEDYLIPMEDKMKEEGKKHGE